MLLSNQYRIAKPRRIALSPEFSWVVASRRIAIDEALYNKAMEKFDRDLPFTNLFGRGVMRTIIPLVNSMKYKISQVLGKEGGLGQKGFDSVDWNTGEVVKILPPHPDAPPLKSGEPPKTSRVKLGKALERLPDGLEKRHLLKWWSENADTVRKDDFSIVISRHPVDVLRMSDHETWINCHSVGGGHFDSCVNEMKHGGLVAYLVNTDYFEEFRPEQLSGMDEIFFDRDRKIDGIRPVSRLRIRRYTHKDGDYDLAIPEMKVYGQQSTEFENQVTDWTRKTQENILGGKRPGIEEFIRRGGQYRDYGYDDAEWFNNFFRDTRDTGDTKYGVQGEETEEIDTRLRQAMETAEREYTAVLKNCRVEYDEVGHNEDNQLTFSWSGQFTIILPESMIIDLDHIRDIEVSLDELRDHLYKNKFFVKPNIDISSYNNESLYFNFDVEDVDNEGEGSPVQFRNFCSHVYHLYDTKFRGIERAVIQWLMENEFAHPSPTRKFHASNPQFQNFVVKLYQGNLRATASEPVGTYDTSQWWRERDILDPVDAKIRSLLAKEIDQIAHMHRNPEQYLPGFPPKNAGDVNEHLNLYGFRVNLTPVNKQLILKIWFEADDVTTEKDLKEIITVLGIVDRLFPKFVAESGKILDAFQKKEKDFQDMLGNII